MARGKKRVRKSSVNGQTVYRGERRTRKGNKVTTLLVPTRAKRKRVKTYSYGTSGGRRYVVETTTTKTYKNAKAAQKGRNAAVKRK